MTDVYGPGQLASHAICAAAGARDGLRVAQFYVKDLSRADRWGRMEPRRGKEQRPAAANADFISRQVARLAGLADRIFTWTVNRWIDLVVPDWRKLPSPFTPGMMREVAGAIRANSFIANPLFNAYFYRAAVHILLRFRAPPFLVLEYRVDSARRELASVAQPASSETQLLARILIALVAAAPIARPGTDAGKSSFQPGIDLNVTVYATACVTLLFAEAGKPVPEVDEDQFFAVVATLISAKLPAIARAVEARDEAGLSSLLLDIKSIY